jgi:hypothetical protein
MSDRGEVFALLLHALCEGFDVFGQGFDAEDVIMIA